MHTRRIEYLRALDDGTWDTIVVHVPGDEKDLVAYANTVLAPQAQHRRVVLFVVYSEEP